MFSNMLFKIARQSLWYRRNSVLLSIAAIGVSVFTLLCTEHIRQATRDTFSSTVSGVDLIVGPRTSELNLLLTTVFRIGQPTQNIRWQSYQQLLEHESIAWAIPISLGDSHKGFRVVGTDTQFFTHYQYGQARKLTFSKGKAFAKAYDIVLGARVAQQLHYTLNEKITLSHGIASTSFHTHDTYPFQIRGVLSPTGTPVDNALYVSLEGLEAVHRPATHTSSTKQSPTSISAAMVGLNSKFATFTVQRELNTFKEEPLTAILPGVVLTQLWQMSRGLESTLTLMTQLILLASLLGLGAMMMATLRERSYELWVLQILGARASMIAALIQLETLLVAILGIMLGGSLFILGIFFTSDIVATHYGIDINLSHLSSQHALTTLYVLSGAIAIGTLPALIGYIHLQKRGKG